MLSCALVELASLYNLSKYKVVVGKLWCVKVNKINIDKEIHSSKKRITR